MPSHHTIVSLQADRVHLNRRARDTFGETIPSGFRLGTQNAWLVDGRVFVHDVDSDQFFLAIPFPGDLGEGRDAWLPNYLVIEGYPVETLSGLKAALRAADTIISRLSLRTESL